MVTIKEHYDIELSKEKPNQVLLSYLLKVLERKTLTLEEWRLTGKFIPKKDFIAENPTAEILTTCQEVIEYVGKSYIQVMSSGTFRYKSDIKSKVLDEVEDIIWKEVSEKIWM